MKLLFISTPVGVLGTGAGGGVELSLKNVAQVLQSRGHQVDILAPEQSAMTGLTIIPISGALHIPAQTRDTPIAMPENSVLANMMDWARVHQRSYDLILSWAFDWLPFYLTPFFETAIAHFVSMGSLSDALDTQLSQTIRAFPGTLGVYTQTQADTFPFGDQCVLLSSGLDLSLYEACFDPQPQLAWLGRVSPEKALEDAVQVAQTTSIPLHIFGKIEHPDYWQQIQADYPDAPITYRGFLSTMDLQTELRNCQALLVTPRWVEAFGNVAIEALACGVPVIAYRRGGPAGIVRDEETGFLVEPDDVQGLIQAVGQLDAIDRGKCRQQAETEYSLEALGDRFEQWLAAILARA